MTRNKPTATVIEMQPKDYAKSRTRLITMWAAMTVQAAQDKGWDEETMEHFIIGSLSAFELGCHMGMHNPDIAEVWAGILGGNPDSERWRMTHDMSHTVTQMLSGDVVAEHVDVSAAADLVNKLNEQDAAKRNNDEGGEGNERPN